MKFKSVLLALVVVLSSCLMDNKPVESPSLKEARATYDRMMKIADESNELAQQKMDVLAERRDSVLAEGDSLVAEKLGELNKQLDKILKQIEGFQSDAKEMRAHSALQVEGEPHDHDHSHGTAPVAYEKLSDEELLELQVALENGIKELKVQIDSIQTEE